MERYLGAAQKISRLAVGIAPPIPNVDAIQLREDLAQDDQRDGLPPGTRGGTLISSYNFPLDAGYVIQARLSRRGASGGEEIDIPCHPQAAQADLQADLKVRTTGTQADLKVRTTGTQADLKVRTTGNRDVVPTFRSAEGAESCARTILNTLARRAYRRPATDQDLDRLMTFYEEGRAEGGFDAGIQRALERLMVSPQEARSGCRHYTLLKTASRISNPTRADESRCRPPPAGPARRLSTSGSRRLTS